MNRHFCFPQSCTVYNTRRNYDNCKGTRHNTQNTILTGLLRHTKTNLHTDKHAFGISRSVVFFVIISLTSRYVQRKRICDMKCVLILRTDFSLSVSQNKKKLSTHCHRYA
jgi:hypothetical protein